MNLINQVLGWFADAGHWAGSGGVPSRLLEHLYYSALAVLAGLVIAVPVGALVGHSRRGGFAVVGLANGLRALPELGLLTLLVLLMGIDLLPVIIALSVLAVPPLLAGTYAGVRNVDRSVVDAARGMGAAALQVIATAAVAAFVSFGGLGRFLIDGLRTRDYPQMAAGALLVAVLALLVEGALALLQRAVVSPGLRPAGGTRRSPTDTVLHTGSTTGSPTGSKDPLTPSRIPETAGVDQ
jgi:osmoprotectant transport system permease protein